MLICSEDSPAGLEQRTAETAWVFEKCTAKKQPPSVETWKHKVRRDDPGRHGFHGHHPALSRLRFQVGQRCDLEK